MWDSIREFNDRRGGELHSVWDSIGEFNDRRGGELHSVWDNMESSKTAEVECCTCNQTCAPCGTTHEGSAHAKVEISQGVVGAMKLDEIMDGHERMARHARTHAHTHTHTHTHTFVRSMGTVASSVNPEHTNDENHTHRVERFGAVAVESSPPIAAVILGDQ